MHSKNSEKMAIKLNKLAITGLRGVKERLELPLLGKSLLIYGDNGTGKSSISDTIEWFYTNAVSHLSGNEIDLNEAIRNSFLKQSDNSLVDFSFTNAKLNCIKTLSYKRTRFASDVSNETPEFESYIVDSASENLLLRYQFLTDFIDNTKGEKLKYLSDIIGFSEVTKTKEVLRKSYSSLKSEIKTQNFETQINTQKQILISKIGAAVSQEKDLFESINKIIKPLKTGIEINSIKDIDKVLEQIKKPTNQKVLKELSSLENINTALSNLQKEIAFIDKEYSKYYNEFDVIANDVQSIMQTFLQELLEVGNVVLTKKYHKEDTCPLCLQPKTIEDLKKELQKRLKEIEDSSKKKIVFDNSKKNITNIISERIKRIEVIEADQFLNDEENKEIKITVDKIKTKLTAYLNAGAEKVTSGNKLAKASKLILTAMDFSELINISERIKSIGESLKKDNHTEIYSNISASKDAFLRIKKFEKEKEILTAQQSTFEKIYNEFVKKQKEGLESFINTFSDKINEFYQYMNPGELIQEIRIVSIGEEDELNGITIEYKYNGNWVSPPQKYFSESHLNCFGISFFLASVIAFNKVNKFIVFDDVISSFDTNHRQRFANLLFEKFADYQIILLTHEQEWFSYVRQLAKRNSWAITEVKWSNEKGTHLDPKPSELKELIEYSIQNSAVDFIGNPIRQYLEYSLKDICSNLDVKVSFRYNDVNEKRMPDELISELKSKINKSSTELKAKIITIDRVANSSLLGNLLSHDNPFNPKIGDLKAFWADIKDLESIFFCSNSDCKKPKVSLKNYDTVAKKIRCGCDTTKYDWKE